MKKLPLITTRFVILSGLLAASLANSQAASKTWNNAGATDYNLGTSWTPAGAPGASDNAAFANTAVSNPVLTGSTTNQGITFNSTAIGYTLSSTNGATLTLTNNGQTSSTAFQHDSTGTNTISAPIVLGRPDAGPQWANVTAGNLVISGPISATLNTTVFSKNGSGILTLTGSNSFSGFNNTTASQVNVGHAYALGSGSATLGAVGNFTAILDNVSGGSLTLANSLYNLGSVNFIGTNNLDLGTAAVTMVATGKTITVASNTLTIGGAIGGGAVSLNKAGAGTLVLSGTSTYTGTTGVTAGLMKITGQLGNTITGVSGGTLSLENAGAVNQGTLSATGSGRLVETVANAITGATTVTVNGGSANVVLSMANNYSGSTTTTSGTLHVNNGGALGSGALVFNGGYLDNTSGTSVSVSTGNQILLNAVNSGTFVGSNNLNLGTGTMVVNGGDRTLGVGSGLLTVANMSQEAATARAFTKSGAGAMIITGSNSNTGRVTVSGGILAVTGSLNNAGSVQLNGGVFGLNGTFNRALGTTAGNVGWNAGVTGSGGFAAYGASSTWGDAANNLTVNLGGNASLINWEAANFVQVNNTLIFSSTLSNGTVDFRNSLFFGNLARTIQVDRGASAPADGIDAIISGTLGGNAPGSLVKTGAGVLALTGSAGYGGGTAINGGTLMLGNNSVAGSVQGNVTGSTGATLAFNRSNGYNFTGTISGGLGVRQMGSGTTTLSAVNTYTGSTRVSAGTLILTGTSAAGTGGINIAGGTLQVNVSGGSLAVTNAITFTGTAGSYVLDRAVGTNYSVYAAASDIVGGVDTGAAILAGTAGGARTLATSFDIAPNVTPTNPGVLVSDVFSLNGTGSDIFVLQLSIADVTSDMYLGWINGSNTWVNAVTGNSATGGSAIAGFAGSYASSGASASGAYLGSWGYDTAADTVWAVLDHNSEFGVVAVPEPSTAGLLGLGATVALYGFRRRRKKD